MTLLLAGLAGCADKPAAFFPIGLYGVNDPAALDRLRREGFNAAQTYNQDPAFLAAMAKAADKAGMRLLADPHGLMASSAPVRGFPLAAWYLFDEPDVQKMRPEALCSLAEKVRSWSPQSRGAFVVGDGRKAHIYKDCGDVLMVDWYPVPHLPLESAGDHVRMTVEAAGKKPVWAVLQAMNWKDYPQRDPKKPRIGRFPDLYELRFMTYHAVLEGARGVWYFAYTKPDATTLADAPEEWFAVASMAKELAALRTIFEKGEPTYLPFPPDPDGVLAKAWRHWGRDYVIIANPRPDVMQLVPEELLQPRWRPLFEARRGQEELLKKVGDNYYLPPYRVMVLEGRLRPLKPRLKRWLP